MFRPKYPHFCRKKVISAEILMFLPKEGCFCISAETDFWTESLFRHVDQKKIRPNYSAESLFGRTLLLVPESDFRAHPDGSHIIPGLGQQPETTETDTSAESRAKDTLNISASNCLAGGE